MQKCRTTRCRRVWIALWPTLLAGSLLTLFAIWAGAEWPHNWGVPAKVYNDEQLQAMRDGRGPSIIGWQDFVIFVTAIAFLWIKSSLLIRRMRKPVDWLTMALIATNLSFSFLYLLIIASALWPLWFYDHPYTALKITRSFRIVFIASLGWGIVMLSTLPDPYEPEREGAYDPKAEEERPYDLQRQPSHDG